MTDAARAAQIWNLAQELNNAIYAAMKEDGMKVEIRIRERQTIGDRWPIPTIDAGILRPVG